MGPRTRNRRGMGFEFDRVKPESELIAMQATESKTSASPARELTSEVLILPDGRVLAHDLTATFADLLSELDPQDEHISRRQQLVQEINA